MPATYYRLHDISRSAPESLLREDARSVVWSGVVHRRCSACSGFGTEYSELYEEDVRCDVCKGNGEIAIEYQAGTSVCRTVDSLRYYMQSRAGRVDADVRLVEVEADELDEQDVDAADGAVLVRVTRVVSVSAVPWSLA